jgi:hypothetical protein
MSATSLLPISQSKPVPKEHTLQWKSHIDDNAIGSRVP